MPDYYGLLGEYQRSSVDDSYSVDCSEEAFSRCVEPAGGFADAARSSACHDMSCTADGQLRIDGEACNSGAPPPVALLPCRPDLWLLRAGPRQGSTCWQSARRVKVR